MNLEDIIKTIQKRPKLPDWKIERLTEISNHPLSGALSTIERFALDSEKYWKEVEGMLCNLQKHIKENGKSIDYWLNSYTIEHLQEMGLWIPLRELLGGKQKQEGEKQRD